MILARFFFTRLNDKSYKRTGPVVTHSTSQNLENPPVFANGKAIHHLAVKLPVRKAFGWAYVPIYLPLVRYSARATAPFAVNEENLRQARAAVAGQR